MRNRSIRGVDLTTLPVLMPRLRDELVFPNPVKPRRREARRVLRAVVASLVVELLAGVTFSAAAAETPSNSDAAKHAVASSPKPQPEGTRKMVERLRGISREVDPFIVPYFAGATADLVAKKFPDAKSPGERATMQWKRTFPADPGVRRPRVRLTHRLGLGPAGHSSARGLPDAYCRHREPGRPPARTRRLQQHQPRSQAKVSGTCTPGPAGPRAAQVS